MQVINPTVAKSFLIILSLTSSALAIFKGKPAEKHEFSYQVALLLINEGIDEPVLCNGAILNPSWIISTASCLTSHIPENLNAVAGVHYVSAWTNFEHRRGLSKVVTHPDYDMSGEPNAPYDIGVAQLNDPFILGDSVQAVTLPEKRAYPSGSGWVAGWGGTLYIYLRPNDLMKAEVKVSHKNGCIESAAGPVFCATHSNHSPICKWDDGAPLVQENEKGQLVLIGIATIPFIPQTTNKCPTTTQSSKFASVSELRDWIESAIE